MIYNRIRRGLFAAAGLLLLAACGEGKGPDGPGSVQLPSTPSGPGEGTPGGNDREPTGGAGNEYNENESDEERAEREVVFDASTEQLMYRGLYYAVTGDNTVSAVDYYDLELAEAVFPDEISYDGKSYRVTEIGEEAFSYCYELARVSIGKNVERIGDRSRRPLSAPPSQAESSYAVL
ncbi:MAG: leucine-rich repeat domain-containing protein, partial [Lachnospiraceae bacterium]|nr:leucine-rich repeat domain-containing protein [Lachnospiraceae bacterium]